MTEPEPRDRLVDLEPLAVLRRPPAVPAGRRWRRRLERLVLVAIGLLLWRTWGACSYRLEGGSMAPALLGPSRRADCLVCGWQFAVGDHEPLPWGQRGVCPECGAVGGQLAEAPAVGGERVLAARGTFALRTPRRWELAALRDPVDPGRILVKRLVGLPGERLEIRGGDLYADGRLVRKTLVDQRAVAILVSGGDLYRSPPRLPESRWRPEADSSRWRPHGADWRIAPLARAAGEPGGVEWLEFQHLVPRPGEPPRPGQPAATDPAPVDDRLAYNASRPELDRHPVRDLLLVCDLVPLGAGKLVLRAEDGAHRYDAVCDLPRRRGSAVRDGAPLGEFDLPPDAFVGPTRVELSLVDRQWTLSIDRRVVWEVPLVELPRPAAGDAAASSPPPPSTRPFAIGVQEMGVVVRQPRVYRDVYYLPSPVHGNGPWEAPRDSYLVLGDNPAVSADSRNWDAPAAVPAQLLVGKPFVVYWAPRAVRLWGGLTRVPDPTAIRYIR